MVVTAKQTVPPTMAHRAGCFAQGVPCIPLHYIVRCACSSTPLMPRRLCFGAFFKDRYSPTGGGLTSRG